jgi:hypothetical protein
VESLRGRPEALYEGIELAEMLTCVTDKWNKRITKERP